jgi:glyoxylase I family protein
MIMARMEHFAVFATDLAGTKDFYVQNLGLKVILDNSSAPVAGYFLGDDRGVALEVIQRPPDQVAVNTRFVCHAAFLVDDYARAKSALQAKHVDFEIDTEVDNETMKTGFFRDPDGNRCQIVWRAKPLGT